MSAKSPMVTFRTTPAINLAIHAAAVKRGLSKTDYILYALMADMKQLQDPYISSLVLGTPSPEPLK